MMATVRRFRADAGVMRRGIFTYSIIVLTAILIVAGLLRLGDRWLPSHGARVMATTAPLAVFTQMIDNAQRPLARLLLQLVVVVLTARAFATVARRLGQPPVVGEIAAGVLLGPSLLGWILPSASRFLFADASMSTLQLLSQIGVLLFMFVVGLEIDPAHLRGKAHAAIAVSHFSIIVPFTLGVTLALFLYTPYAAPGVPFYAFALFVGIAMSITAFPVLARILDERHLTHTPLGATAITCAAVDDVTAWTLLAFVVALVTARGATVTLLGVAVASVIFVLVMAFVGRPFLRRVLASQHVGRSLTKGQAAIVLAALLTSALITESIGIHALFGAFIAGTLMPRDRDFRALLRDRLESISSVFLLPLFFVYTGLRTEVGLLGDVTSWAICLGIVMVATAGKLGGTSVAARWTGLQWRDSIALGALMNCRGLMELIALNVGYDLGILTPKIFTMMVLMALVTTAMTGPLLSLALNWGRRRALPPGPLPRSA
jgi:Kef-type K+ transport system membrane component KefB